MEQLVDPEFTHRSLCHEVTTKLTYFYLLPPILYFEWKIAKI
jgi:hypothetical protein